MGRLNEMFLKWSRKKKIDGRSLLPIFSGLLGDSKMNRADTEILQCLRKLIHRRLLLLETQAVTSVGVTRHISPQLQLFLFPLQFEVGIGTDGVVSSR